MSVQSEVGFFIWSWNSEDWLQYCLHTFRETTGASLIGIANAPTDQSWFHLNNYCDYVLYNPVHESVSQCVNKGYDYLFDAGYKYMGWIHPDQRFFQHDWVEVLKKTLDTYPQIGKISACNTRIEDPIRNVIFPGSEAANLIRRDTWKVTTWDTSYIGIGGYDDWDYQQQLVEDGLASAITPGALMWHQGMGTRSKRPNHINYTEAIHNAEVYETKWKTNEAVYAPKNWQHLPIVR